MHKTPGRKKHAADYHAAGDLIGADWVGGEVVNANTPTLWVCRTCGHRWTTKYSHVFSGHGCRKCASKKLSERSRFDDSKYHELAARRGWVWLGPPVANSSIKTTWQTLNCVHGAFEKSYRDAAVQHCPGCAAELGVLKRRLQNEDYRKLAEEKGIKWAGEHAVGSNTPTFWICGQGHSIVATYGNVKQDRFCRRCFRQRRAEMDRLDESAYRSAGGSKGITWIGELLPKNTREKTRWLCRAGHTYETTIGAVRRLDGGCQKCKGIKARDLQKVGFNQYSRIGEKCGFKLLSDESDITNANTPVRWKCISCGHEFRAKYGHLQQGDQGCARCSAEILSETQRLPNERYAQIAAQKGLEWSGPPVRNAHEKTNWKCKNDHTFATTYAHIYSGRGCPRCALTVNGVRVSKAQLLIHKILRKGICNYRSGKYVVDIAIKVAGTKIAIEYDGKLWHEGREEYDRQRERELIAEGWKVLRIKETSNIYIVDKLHGTRGRQLRLKIRARIEDAIFRIVSGKNRMVLDIHKLIV